MGTDVWTTLDIIVREFVWRSMKKMYKSQVLYLKPLSLTQENYLDSTIKLKPSIPEQDYRETRDINRATKQELNKQSAQSFSNHIIKAGKEQSRA